MVYHEIKIRRGKRYNYLVKTIRYGRKLKKIRKYLGEGHISKNKIQLEITKFQNKILKTAYLSEDQKEIVENIKTRFDAYLKNGGKSGLENFKEWFFTELTYNSNAI